MSRIDAMRTLARPKGADRRTVPPCLSRRRAGTAGAPRARPGGRTNLEGDGQADKRWHGRAPASATSGRSRDQATAQKLAACPALGADWREKLLD
jgi:hypothetical protein